MLGYPPPFPLPTPLLREKNPSLPVAVFITMNTFGKFLQGVYEKKGAHVWLRSAGREAFVRKLCLYEKKCNALTSNPAATKSAGTMAAAPATKSG